ncbi:MAG TPA: hypothetical protein VGX00_08510 [Thermoplasmata archaeon]|nr:hypothetical protein [Thermoplasmata archaeon]
MVLKRTVRSRGASLSVVIPADIGRLLSVEAGDAFEYDVLGREQLVLRLVKRPAPKSAA